MRLVTFTDTDGREAPGELREDSVVALPAPTLRDWLAGRGDPPSREPLALDSVTLLAPVPVPPSVRDFYAFEGHVAAGWRRRGAPIPDAWYDAPAFYFSNPASIRGPGAPVARPDETDQLDFELEIAAVMGRDATIAGFALMNDWSARDVQRREMTVGLGPHKGKDFATSLGPFLATPDELPYEDGRLHITARVLVNGEEVTRADAAEQHFSWPEIVAHAARDTCLVPGDVLGSGTLTGGCLLEIGPLDGGRWIEPGDVVTIEAEGLGSLSNPITRAGD